VPTVPEDHRVPRQERGVRRARALPYALHADAYAVGPDVHLDLASAGAVASVFLLRSGNPADLPRTYTVRAHDELSEVLAGAAADTYDLEVHGPNGFFRGFRGTSGGGAAAVRVRTAYRRHRLTLEVENLTNRRVSLEVCDRYTGSTVALVLRPGSTRRRSWPLHGTHGWYDLTITADGDAAFRYQYAGHVESGEESISDPLMGGLL